MTLTVYEPVVWRRTKHYTASSFWKIGQSTGLPSVACYKAGHSDYWLALVRKLPLWRCGLLYFHYSLKRNCVNWEANELLLWNSRWKHCPLLEYRGVCVCLFVMPHSAIITSPMAPWAWPARGQEPRHLGDPVAFSPPLLPVQKLSGGLWGFLTQLTQFGDLRGLVSSTTIHLDCLLCAQQKPDGGEFGSWLYHSLLEDFYLFWDSRELKTEDN